MRPNVRKEAARRLRQRQTDAEKALWQRVRNRRFCGKKFLRQHPLAIKQNGQEKFYIADFYCHEKQIVIEVDGGIHDI